MIPPSRHFLLGEDATADKLLELLAQSFEYREDHSESISRTFLDSFDWLLYDEGILLAWDEIPGGAELKHIDIDSGQTVSKCRWSRFPAWPSDIKSERLRELIYGILEVRALMPLCSFEKQLRTVAILNGEQKTIVRLKLEKHEVDGEPSSEPLHSASYLVHLTPVRGYDAEYKAVATFLEENLGEAIDSRRFFELIFERAGRRPFDTSSKQRVQLDPLERSDEAVKRVCLKLLNTIELNEEGVIKATDTEFLHDFRVAVRRTRSVLSQFKRVIPPDILSHFKEEFRWLGRATSPLRDMDVYVIRFEDYQSWLSEDVRENLIPLKKFLLKRQKREHRTLVRALRTKRYQTLLEDWRAYLAGPVDETPFHKDAITPIGSIARKLTWKSYKKAVRQGRAILADPDSPAAAKHELRITCKKLRYLMELFRSLYPPEAIKERISILKKLQDCLGDFQDFTVQQEHLRLFAREMHATNEIPAETYLAMGRLGAHLELLAGQTEDNFEDLFRDFSSKKAEALFAELFKEGIADV